MWKTANRRMKPLHGVILITMMYMWWHVLMPIAEICTPVARVMFRLALFASQMGCDWRSWVKLHAGTMQRAEGGHGCAGGRLARYARLEGNTDR
jgi:hypothetical protein